MSRAQSATFTVATKAANYVYGYAIEMDFPSGFQRINSTPSDVTIGGNVFIGVAGILSIPTVKEGSNLTDGGISIGLSGIPTAYINALLNEHIQNRTLRMWELVFNQDHTLLSSYPIGTWHMDVMTARIGGNTSQITLTAASLWDSWAMHKERFYTDGDQQARYPGDTFFDMLIPNIDKPDLWGRA